MTLAFTNGEIVDGRRLFQGDWQFVAASGSLDSLPKMHATEIAFAGRSNVGKSSLLNMMLARKGLARTSNTPGCTRQINFFDVGLARPAPQSSEEQKPERPSRLLFVDLPGYGYAAASKSKVAAWTELIHAYLIGRRTLARVYVLVDARHGLKATDEPTLEALGEAAVSHQIVLTKADQVKAPELQERIAATEAALAKRPAAFPKVIATSSRDGTGIPDLRAAIAKLKAERA